MQGEALIQSEQLFRTLIEHSPDALTLITPDGTIIYASPTMVHIMGEQVEQMEAEEHARQYKAVFEAMTDIVGVMVTDQEGRMYEVNGRLMRWVTVARSWLVGRCE